MADCCEFSHGKTKNHRIRSVSFQGLIVSYPSANIFPWHIIKSLLIALLLLKSPISGASSCFANIPDPAIIFSRVNDLAPDIKSITVIHYDTAESDLVISAARRSAKSLNLSFNAYPVSTVSAFTRINIDTIKKMRAGSALWLLTEPPPRLLSELLLIAWERKIILISNVENHARKGVFISIWINSNPRYMPPDCFVTEADIYTTVNLTMAKHLGINFSSHQLLRIDTFYPR
jgi:ABC-type uncharacterized transport system substrate-binding protein